ncbi:hypothetical protein BHE74_00037574 [Ensete ventricosum]|nr:hypothetical protein BHE74_00037574 [Ensete ventricosum]
MLQSPFHLEKYGWPAPEETKDDPVMAVEDDHKRPGRFDIWSAIQAKKGASPVVADAPAPYVHPLMRRSSSSLSQMSLQMCTESLGSESGSDDFSSVPDGLDFDYTPKIETKTEEEDHDVHEKVAAVEERGGLWSRTETEERQVPQRKADELVSVNYNCSISRRSPSRSFPPPLPSLSRRDGPCLYMRPHRRDGRLVVEAIPVPSRNYLHAQREGGRLLLSFNGSAMKILRSSLVINKFVGGTPRSSNAKCEQSNINRWQAITPAPLARRPPPTPATAAAAVVVASTLSASTEAYNDVGARPPLGDDEHHLPLDNKLLFTSKRRNREELLHSMKRCKQRQRQRRQSKVKSEEQKRRKHPGEGKMKKNEPDAFCKANFATIDHYPLSELAGERLCIVPTGSEGHHPKVSLKGHRIESDLVINTEGLIACVLVGAAAAAEDGRCPSQWGCAVDA